MTNAWRTSSPSRDQNQNLDLTIPANLWLEKHEISFWGVGLRSSWWKRLAKALPNTFIWEMIIHLNSVAWYLYNTARQDFGTRTVRAESHFAVTRGRWYRIQLPFPRMALVFVWQRILRFFFPVKFNVLAFLFYPSHVLQHLATGADSPETGKDSIWEGSRSCAGLWWLRCVSGRGPWTRWPSEAISAATGALQRSDSAGKGANNDSCGWVERLEPLWKSCPEYTSSGIRGNYSTVNSFTVVFQRTSRFDRGRRKSPVRGV